ncbi:hypothetical protein [uncultured Sphingomonas sp.]
MGEKDAKYDRAERLAAQLRANLLKRKAQARERAHEPSVPPADTHE